jgi:UPF0716 family protein affecting phage T7 exclusion
MTQVLSLLGAFLVLIAFGGLQTGRLTVVSWTYQGCNLAGAVLLALTGILTETWGFVLLNVVWSAFAAVKLVQLASARRLAGS